MSFAFSHTLIPGLFKVLSFPYEDNRGSFLNLYRDNEEPFSSSLKGLCLAQVNLSSTHLAGTIRGLHYQKYPYSEVKIVRCIKGRVWDVVVDLRMNSPTYSSWYACQLSSVDNNALLIPEGCAHGFQVLEDYSQLLYLHTQSWVPEAEHGIRFDDPSLNISWPLPPANMSERDLSLPFFNA